MPVNRRIRPNFILFISGKVSSQWLELQRNEKPLCFSHSPPDGFLGKTAHLVQFLLFPFPFLGSTDDSTRTFHVAFDGFRLFHSPVDLLRFQMCFWLFPLGEPRPEWAGQVQVSREKDVPHLGGSTRSPTSQGLGTGTVLRHPLEGDCPWWQQDIGAPGRFIPRVANAHSRLVLLVRCGRAVVETQHLRVDESSACSVQRSAVRETNVGSRARAPPPFLSLPRPG